MKLFFKILGLLMGILFLWAAFVQYNDPDAFLWYIAYGAAFLVSILFVVGRLPLAAALILGVVYTLGGIYFWPEKFEGVSIGAGDIDNIERARESLGMLMVALVLFIYALRVRYAPNSKL